MVTVKLFVAIITFIISGGHIVFQTFRHHESVNPQHGFLKFVMLSLSVLSLIYLAKDMSDDFDTQAQSAEIHAAEMAANHEISYWHEIDRQPTSENYCAYLEKYPQGRFVEIARHRIPADCLELARQAKAEQQAKTEALIEAKLLAKVEMENQALAEAKQKFEQEAQALAQARADFEARAKVATELKEKVAVQALALQEEKVRLKARFDSAQRSKKIPVHRKQKNQKATPVINALEKTVAPVKNSPENLARIIAEELQQERIQEQAFQYPESLAPSKETDPADLDKF